VPMNNPAAVSTMESKIPGDLHIGYLVDTQNGDIFVAGEKSNTSWVQAFPFGKWTHPEYGDIEMNADRAARMAAGINQGIRDQDIPINYDHGEQRKDAAGWVQRADVRPDGLWLNVEWTREAYQKIKEKAYRYFSPEYMTKWTHPANGQTFKDVFVGGALVNMPHLKGILPLNLSEYFIACADEIEEELGKIEDKALAELTRKSINDLPDSAFAYIEPGGKKDESGKTTPRSLRHFPIHDEAHVRNALARAPQSPFGPKALPKIRAAAKRFGIKVAAGEARPTLEVIAKFYDIEFDESTKDVELQDAIAAMIANIKKQRAKKKTKKTYEEPGSIIVAMSEIKKEEWGQLA
jgi:hypothetical protein